MDVVLYQQRKEAQVCTRCGDPVADDKASLCERHRKEHRQRAKLWADKKRAARAKAGRCIDCGERPEKGHTKLAPRCKPCRIKGGRHHEEAATVVDSHVDSRRQRIASATRVSTLGGEEGRVRYYGKQRKGKPPAGDLDEADLKEIEKAVASTRAALVLARSAEVLALPKLQRLAAIRAAWAILDMGFRFGAEAMQRARYESVVLRRLDRGE